MEYRHLTAGEIEALVSQNCTSKDWDRILVKEGFKTKYVRNAFFSGDIRLGLFDGSVKLPGGIEKHCGIFKATLHNVTVGDNCLIDNVGNYIANYNIGDNCFIENMDILFCDGETSFGNGVKVSVLNETGGREVSIYDRLTAQQAYIMALYRYRPKAVAGLERIVEDYASSVRSSVGTIGSKVYIVDAGYIKNVKVGDCCRIEGARRLENGTVNSNREAVTRIGNSVIAEDFIICSGTTISDGVTLERCFVGQACHLGRTYSASDSLFFANCFGENGEACAVFAGPYTVTHHKSTLLIAGMFSFMNAGSGSNQSNHMYKLGPLHQGIMERGAKTASDSYVLWPAKVGAFSLVLGRHANHQDTSDLPFSYIIEQNGLTYIMPGANLHSVGTIRDARKWPGRDERTDPDKLDCINYNLLSPYTIQKMFNAIDKLEHMQKISGYTSSDYTFQSCRIRRTSLEKGIGYYRLAIDKFLGNSIISRLMKTDFNDEDTMRLALRPTSPEGLGKWIDVGGLLAPKELVFNLLDDIETGAVKDAAEICGRFAGMHANYYEYEWTWAFEAIRNYYGVDLSTAGLDQILSIIERWNKAVQTMDRMYYDDANKEFSLSAMTGFGADGEAEDKLKDFNEARGNTFENNKFVCSIREHMAVKSQLYADVTAKLKSIK